MEKVYDVIVIGGGAAGLFGAIVAASKGKNVAIIEKNDSPGKKILATGNGKCNFTNTRWDADSLRGGKDFAYKVYQSFDYKRTLEFFEKLGVFHYERDGYCYPYSRQAKAVCDCLLHKLYKLGVEIINNSRVISVSRKELFEIKTERDKDTFNYFAKKVLIATGGKSYKSLGSDGSGYKLAKSFGHEITPLYPALVKLNVRENIKSLDGVRVLAKITLSTPDKDYESQGEIIFGKSSVSGIPVFELSRYCGKPIDEGKDVYLDIDLFPNIDRVLLEKIISERHTEISSKTYRLLIGLINDKLAAYFSNNKENENVNTLVSNLKNMKLKVEALGEFDIAQVTAGGVDTKQINPNTMESTLVQGLYFAGEIVDVDGTCGGYNLQWAWSSAYVAGSAM